MGTVPAVRIRSIALTAAALVTCALPACSGGGDGSDGVEGPTTTTEPVGVLESAGLAARVHSAGFLLEVTEARLVRDSVGRAFLEVQAEITNQGLEPAPLNVPAQVVTEAGGVDRIVPGDEPPLPPGEPQRRALRFPVPPDVGERGEGLTEARLVMGSVGNHTAVVPFDGSPPTDLEPRSVPLGGTLTAGSVSLTLQGASVRFDDPLGHENLPEGRALLAVAVTARRSGGGAPNLTAENFRLRLPDGAVIAVRRDGRSAPNVLLETGRPLTDLLVRFEVPNPAAGQHTLILVGPYGSNASEARGEAAIPL